MRREHGECLTEETLTEYLDGGLEPAFKAAAESHLVACAHCREQLAFFMRLLQEQITPDETIALETITAEWDTQQAKQEPLSRKTGLPRYFTALASIAAILVAGVALWIGLRPSAEPKSALQVNQLLLAQNRPFEARMADQPHRPIIRTRGADDASVSYDLLAGEMARLTANSYEMGKFYLLQKKFIQAIPYLEAAEKEAGASAAVHNDLGVAYLETGTASQVNLAEREFQHALQQNRAFAPAAFNLALFYERTNAIAEAESQWKRYLALDTESDWATEAKERVRGLSR